METIQQQIPAIALLTSVYADAAALALIDYRELGSDLGLLLNQLPCK